MNLDYYPGIVFFWICSLFVMFMLGAGIVFSMKCPEVNDCRGKLHQLKRVLNSIEQDSEK